MAKQSSGKTQALFQNRDQRPVMSATAASVSLRGMQDEPLYFVLSVLEIRQDTVCKGVSTVSGPFSALDEPECLCCCGEGAMQNRGW